MKNWLVVANAARARVLEETGEEGVYRHVADLVHPASRLKGSALSADRPGHVGGSAGGTTGSASFDGRSSPHEREREHFARELAGLLNAGIADGRCAGLLLLASNPFLGELKAHLGEQADKALLRTQAVDYTALSDRELAQRLRETP